ncbi:MAG: hypothetical protein WA112_09030 [Rugosibacter sp.]|jgi:hypothetical protein
MPKNPLCDLYEKLYFHEIEVREKLGGRLQTPMAIIVSLIGVLTFLIQNFDNQHRPHQSLSCHLVGRNSPNPSLQGTLRDKAAQRP